MERQVWLLVALVWVPFVSIFAFAAPALAEQVGDSYPHMAFHVLSSGLLVWAAVVAWRLRREARARTQRVALSLLLVSVPLAVVGNLLELASAVDRFVADGWQSERTPDLFEGDAGLHVWASSVTIPSLMVSMLASVLIAVLVTVQGRRRQAVG